MHKRLILILVICLCFIAGAMGAFVMHGPRVEKPNSGVVKLGGPFSLIDHTGRNVTDLDFGSGNKLIYFGYTSGSVSGLAAMQVLTEVLERLGERKDRLAVLFITLDPERDTADRMREFLRPYHKSIVGLTGKKESVDKVLRSYLVYRKIFRDGNSPEYSIQHSGHFYLMDRNNRYLAHFKNNTLPENIIKTIIKYF